MLKWHTTFEVTCILLIIFLAGFTVGLHVDRAYPSAIYEDRPWEDEEQCETDMECYEVCLLKLPPNRPESECDDILAPIHEQGD